jgi:16S rRNA G966 N2-methylase RsmD
MGCGCKNKSNSTPQTQQNQQVQTNNTVRPTNESVQEAIKNTIQKYYTVNKQKS